MRRKLLIFFLCFLMVFTFVCPEKHIVKGSECSVAEVLSGLGFSWVSGLNDFVSGSYVTSHPYFIVYRSASGTTSSGPSQYKYYVVRFSVQPSSIRFYDYGNKYYDSSNKQISTSYIKVMTSNAFSLNQLNSGNVLSITNTSLGSSAGVHKTPQYTDVYYANFDYSLTSDSIAVNFTPFTPSVPEHVHEWDNSWSTDNDYHWHVCLNTDGKCDITSLADMDSYSAHVFDDDFDSDCNTCGFVRSVPHVHEWDNSWSTDNDYHWHVCLNTDGKCDITSPGDMDSYGAHVFDDDSDSDCNICGFVRVIVPVVPSVSPTATPTPTPRPTATPTPTPPPYLPGGYDENGNWVGYTEFESTSLNYLQDMKILLGDILWYLKNMVALSLILVCFESLKIVRSWVKGVGLK